MTTQDEIDILGAAVAELKGTVEWQHQQIKTLQSDIDRLTKLLQQTQSSSQQLREQVNKLVRNQHHQNHIMF